MQIKKSIKILSDAITVYEKLSSFEFLNKINSSAGVISSLVFENDRIQKYSLCVEGVGKWESEKILLPEVKTLLIHRVKPMLPFKYMIVIYRIEEIENDRYSILHYTEEFELEKEDKHLENNIFRKIVEKDNGILSKIAESFNDCEL